MLVTDHLIVARARLRRLPRRLVFVSPVVLALPVSALGHVAPMGLQGINSVKRLARKKLSKTFAELLARVAKACVRGQQHESFTSTRPLSVATPVAACGTRHSIVAVRVAGLALCSPYYDGLQPAVHAIVLPCAVHLPELSLRRMVRSPRRHGSC